MQLRGSEYKSREVEIVSGGSTQQPRKLTQRVEVGTVGNNWNCRELLEQSGKLTQRAKFKTAENN